MRLVIVSVLCICSVLGIQCQTLLFSEDFEPTTLPDSVFCTGTGSYGNSYSQSSQGTRSDSMRISASGDSVVMTTQSFSSISSPYVMLYFDHICKIEFFDEGYIEVSNDNGTTWSRLTGTHYKGVGQFANQGNKFNIGSYPVDWAAGIYAVPANSWWKSEVFDISLLASNAASVQIRFVLRDAQPGNTMPDNYAWFIDHIRVIGMLTDAFPPVIAINPPIFADTVYSAGPFVINATITDASGIDTAILVYTVNSGAPDTIAMVHVSGSLFTASIPIQPFNSAICYKIVAIDGYVSPNTGGVPAQGCISFYTKYALAGTYTVGGTGADYASVTDALNSVTQAGVYGPVIFLINPGTYAGQYTFETIEGTSLVNTVTFRSATGNHNDVIWLTYPVTANFAVRFNNARCITLKQITIRSTNGTADRVVDFSGSNNHIVIDSCFVDAPMSLSAVMYSSVTNPLFNITISNCTLKGGVYGMRFDASLHYKIEKLNLVNNYIHDYNRYGIYTRYVDSLYIVGNRLQNAVNSWSVYPIYITKSTGGGIISKNRIVSTGSGSNYGLYLTDNQSTATDPLLVSNNFISQSGNASSTVQSIYIASSNYINFYHNSVHITGGSATLGRCFFLASGSGINIVNNIFANSNSGYAYYINAPAAVGTANHNNFHSTGPNFAYWSTNQTTLAGLQTVSGKELNSLVIQPPFTSIHDLRLTNTLLSGKGLYLASVPDDVCGTPRSQIPSIGAHEYPLIPNDVGVTAFVTPTSQSVITEASSVPVTVTMINHGTDTITSANVFYRINNDTPVMASFNGQLAQFQSANIVLPPFVSPAGDVMVAAWTALPGDTNSFNDTAFITCFGIPLFDAGIKQISPYPTPCGLGLETVKVLIENKGVNTIPANFSVSYKLHHASIVVTHTVPDSIPVMDSLIFAFPTPANLSASVDTTFELSAWVDLSGDNMPSNDTAHLIVKSFILPPQPSVLNPVNIAYGARATLNASCPYLVGWYASDTSQVKLDIGSAFETPYLFDTTTFYAASSFRYWQGGLNLLTTYSGNHTSYGDMFNIIPNKDITIDSFDVHIKTGTTTTVEVYYREGSYLPYISTQSGWILAGSATVTPAGPNLPTRVPIGGLTLTGGQTYGLYITLQTSGSLANTYIWGSGIVTRTGPDFDLVLGNSGPKWSAINAERQWNGGIYYSIESEGCSSLKVPIQVNVGAPPPVDAGIEAIVNPQDSAVTSIPYPILVRLKNYGTDTLTSASIIWSLNNVLQDTFAWSGSIPYSNIQLVTLDTVFFQSGANCIKVWTFLPNGVVDTIFQNDTATHCINAFSVSVITNDVGVSSIISPPCDSIGNICLFEATSHQWYQYDVDVRIKNYGQNTQTMIPIAYTFFNAGPVHTYIWNGSLEPGDSVDVTLQNKFLPKSGAQQVCVMTTLAGDPIASNNEACKNYVGVYCSGLNNLLEDGFALGQNIPNPATKSTTISYFVPHQRIVTFSIVSLVGQVFFTETYVSNAGQNQIEIDVTNLAPGVYYYFIESNGQRLTRKLLVNR